MSGPTFLLVARLQKPGRPSRWVEGCNEPLAVPTPTRGSLFYEENSGASSAFNGANYGTVIAPSLILKDSIGLFTIFSYILKCFYVLVLAL